MNMMKMKIAKNCSTIFHLHRRTLAGLFLSAFCICASAETDTAFRISGPDVLSPSRVYLLQVESQTATNQPWNHANPDQFKVTVSGGGKLVIDPALKPMNPFTIEVPADASNAVQVSVESTNGAVATRMFVIASPVAAEKFVADIQATNVTHHFDGLGAGVLFYDNQFDISSSGEIYDWCFADVKASFLHLLIRPDCQPEDDTNDWRKIDFTKFDFKSTDRPLRIAREALKRNPHLKIYVSIYTPPAWMKSNNKTRGDGTLKDGLIYRQKMAKYVFAWLKHAQAAGIPTHYLAFFNEPDWMHTQDGMNFQDMGMLADTFTDCAAALDELIAADGSFTVKPKLLFPDALGAGSITRGGANTEKLKSRTNELARVDVWGVHDYWNTSGDYWQNRYRELRAFPGVGDKPIWMTEWAQRERHGDLDSALEYGRNILNAVRLGASGWLVFEWMHPYGNQAGLISTDWGTETGARRYWRSKAYQVFRQIANTTPVGAEVVEMKKISGSSLEYLALKHDGKLIVHLMNSAPGDVACELQLANWRGIKAQAWQTTPHVAMQKATAGISVSANSTGGANLSAKVPAYSLLTIMLTP